MVAFPQPSRTLNQDPRLQYERYARDQAAQQDAVDQTAINDINSANTLNEYNKRIAKYNMGDNAANIVLSQKLYAAAQAKLAELEQIQVGQINNAKSLSEYESLLKQFSSDPNQIMLDPVVYAAAEIKRNELESSAISDINNVNDYNSYNAAIARYNIGTDPNTPQLTTSVYNAAEAKRAALDAKAQAVQDVQDQIAINELNQINNEAQYKNWLGKYDADKSTPTTYELNKNLLAAAQSKENFFTNQVSSIQASQDQAALNELSKITTPTDYTNWLKKWDQDKSTSLTYELNSTLLGAAQSKESFFNTKMGQTQTVSQTVPNVTKIIYGNVTTTTSSSGAPVYTYNYYDVKTGKTINTSTIYNPNSDSTIRKSTTSPLPESVWNNTSVGLIRQSGYKNLSEWKLAYNLGIAPDPRTVVYVSPTSFNTNLLTGTSTGINLSKLTQKSTDLTFKNYDQPLIMNVPTKTKINTYEPGYLAPAFYPMPSTESYKGPSIYGIENTPEKTAALQKIAAEEAKLGRVLSPLESYQYLQKPTPSQFVTKAAELSNEKATGIESYFTKPILGLTAGVSGAALGFAESIIPWKEYNIFTSGGTPKEAIVSYGTRNPLATFVSSTGELVANPVGVGGEMVGKLAANPFYEVPKFAGELYVFGKTTQPLINVGTGVIGETVGTSRAIGVVAGKKVYPIVEPYVGVLKNELSPIISEAKIYKSAATELGKEFVTDVKGVGTAAVTASKKVTDPLSIEYYIRKQNLESSLENIKGRYDLTVGPINKNIELKLENLRGQYDLTLQSAKMKTIEPVQEFVSSKISKAQFGYETKIAPKLENLGAQFEFTKMKTATKVGNVFENVSSGTKLAFENLKYKYLPESKSPIGVDLYFTPNVLEKPLAVYAGLKVKAGVIGSKATKPVTNIMENIKSGVETQRIKYSPIESKLRSIWDEIELQKTRKNAPEFVGVEEPGRALTRETTVSNIRTPYNESMSLLLKDFPSEFAGPAEIAKISGKEQYFTQASPSKSPFIKSGEVKPMAGGNLTRSAIEEMLGDVSESGFFTAPPAQNVFVGLSPKVIAGKKQPIIPTNANVPFFKGEKIGPESYYPPWEPVPNTTQKFMTFEQYELNKNLLNILKQRGDLYAGSGGLNILYKDFPRAAGDADIISKNPKAAVESYATGYRSAGVPVKVKLATDVEGKYGTFGKYIIKEKTTGEKLLEIERTVNGKDLYNRPFIKQQGVKIVSSRATFTDKVEQGIDAMNTKAIKDVEFLSGGKLKGTTLTKPEIVPQNYIYYTGLGEQASLYDALIGKAKTSWGPSITITKGIAEKPIPTSLKITSTPIKAWERVELEQFFNRIESPKYKGPISPYKLDKTTGKPIIKNGKPLTIREEITGRYGDQFIEYARANKYYKELGADISPGTAAQTGIRAEFEATINPTTKVIGKTTTPLGKVKQVFNIPEQSIKLPTGQTVGLSFAEIKNPKTFTQVERVAAAKRALTPNENYFVKKYMNVKEPKNIYEDIFRKEKSYVPEKNFYVGRFLSETLPKASLISTVNPISSSLSRGASSMSGKSSGTSGGISGGGSSGGTSSGGSISNIFSLSPSKSRKSNVLSTSGSVSRASNISSGGSSGISSRSISSGSNSLRQSISSGFSGMSSLSPPSPPEEPPPYQFKSDNESSKQRLKGYDVFVRKGIEPETGKKRKVGEVLVERGLPYGVAVNKGLGIAAEYAQRTAILRPSKKVPTIPDELVNRDLLSEFRSLRPKTKINKGPGDIIYVEQSKYAINTINEKRGIPWKAARLAKAKRNNFGSFSGMKL